MSVPDYSTPDTAHLMFLTITIDRLANVPPAWTASKPVTTHTPDAAILSAANVEGKTGLLNGNISHLQHPLRPDILPPLPP